ncbi:MAG: VRR-NUC domain-containing protein [Planctomycetota bacterium]
MLNENGVKEAVKRRLKKRGAWWTMPHQRGFSQAGVPDILVCINGRFLAIETKYGKNRPTARQQQQLDRIETAGGTAVVINENDLPALEELLDELASR